MGKAWKCNIEDWDIIDDGKVDFILEESRLYLKSLLEGFEKLNQKAFIFLGVLFTVISGLTGFFVSKYSFDSTQQNWKLLLPALAIVSTCFISYIFFIKCILPSPGIAETAALSPPHSMNCPGSLGNNPA